MKSNIDHVFASKLQKYEKRPSEEAWSKINHNIKRKERKFSLFQIAASIVLVVASGYLAYSLFFNQSYNDANTLSNTNDQLVSPEINNKHQETIITNKENVTAQKAKDDPIKVEDSQVKQYVVADNNQQQPFNENNYEQETKEPERTQVQLEAIPKLALSENPVSRKRTTLNARIRKNEASPSPMPVTITYKRGNASAENPEILAVNIENEKDSGLKKLIDIAKEVKNGNIGLSDFREIKDELFATDINFRKLNIIQKEKNN